MNVDQTQGDSSVDNFSDDIEVSEPKPPDGDLKFSIRNILQLSDCVDTIPINKGKRHDFQILLFNSVEKGMRNLRTIVSS